MSERSLPRRPPEQPARKTEPGHSANPPTTVGELMKILNRYDPRTPVVQHASPYSKGYDGMNRQAFELKRITANGGRQDLDRRVRGSRQHRRHHRPGLGPVQITRNGESTGVPVKQPGNRLNVPSR